MADRTPGRSARQRKRRTAARVVDRARTITTLRRKIEAIGRFGSYIRRRNRLTPQDRRMCGKE